LAIVVAGVRGPVGVEYVGFAVLRGEYIKYLRDNRRKIR
jgi:hypothetical protein